MNRFLFCMIVVCGVAGGVRTASATEIWVLGGEAFTQRTVCTAYIWFGEAIFLNPTDGPAVVHVIDVSTGPAGVVLGQDISMAAHQAIAIPSQVPAENGIRNALWVMHVSVPDWVAVSSRIELESYSTCSVRPVLPFFPTNGRMSFAVYKALQPPNVARYFVGSDLGGIPARNNVAIYNAGAVPASAQVELHRACDGAVIGSTMAVIPANTVQQVPLGGIDPLALCVSSSPPPYAGYVSVRVDQPSATWVSTLATDREIVVSYGTSTNSQ
jgi:hypothetical protein